MHPGTLQKSYALITICCSLVLLAFTLNAAPKITITDIYGDALEVYRTNQDSESSKSIPQHTLDLPLTVYGKSPNGMLLIKLPTGDRYWVDASFVKVDEPKKVSADCSEFTSTESVKTLGVRGVGKDCQ